MNISLNTKRIFSLLLVTTLATCSSTFSFNPSKEKSKKTVLSKHATKIAIATITALGAIAAAYAAFKYDFFFGKKIEEKQEQGPGQGTGKEPGEEPVPEKAVESGFDSFGQLFSFLKDKSFHSVSSFVDAIQKPKYFQEHEHIGF